MFIFRKKWRRLDGRNRFENALCGRDFFLNGEKCSFSNKNAYVWTSCGPGDEFLDAWASVVVMYSLECRKSDNN